MEASFPLPNEILLKVLSYLDGWDVRSFGNTCRNFRRFIISNKCKLRKPDIIWPQAYLLFGRRIILRRILIPLEKLKLKKKLVESLRVCWEFTEEEFVRDFASLFFVLAPDTLYVKCKELDENIVKILKSCIGVMWGRTFALEFDRCTLEDNALRDFFGYFSPFFLHLSGHFDRSILSDQTLPLSTLFSLFIGVNRSDTETRTRVSGITVRKIVNNWFHQYCSGGLPTSMYPIKNYERRKFLIEIPDCDLDYNEFLAFFKELTLFPHGTIERIGIHNLPRTLVHNICRSILTFNTIGPAVWVQQGLCNSDDIVMSCKLLCDCDPGLVTVHNHLTIDDMPAEPSQLCDTVGLYLSMTVSVTEEMLQPRKHLLQLSITLKVSEMSAEAIIPEPRFRDTHKRRRKI